MKTSAAAITRITLALYEPARAVICNSMIKIYGSKIRRESESVGHLPEKETLTGINSFDFYPSGFRSVNRNWSWNENLMRVNNNVEFRVSNKHNDAIWYL